MEQLRVLLIPLIIALPLFTFWAWMFREMTANDRLSGSQRYYWTLALALGNIFAALSYYLLVHRNRH